MLLKAVKARKIKDSRGDPTIEVIIEKVKASAPSGKSTGKYETHPYHKSLDWNIKFLNSQVFNLEVNSFDDLKKLELFIKKKAKLRDAKQFGANALFALECAILKALAKEQKKQLWQIINAEARKIPIPLGNVIEGGLHAHNKDHPTFQEFLVIPNEKSFEKNYILMKKIHSELHKLLNENKKTDEGAWESRLHNSEIFTILSSFKGVRLGTDAAASSFYKNGNYQYKSKSFGQKEQINYVNTLIKKYNLLYIEDPLHEEDFQGFSQISKASKHLVVGDDLTATQISRLKKAIKLKSINAIIIKPNQNGSLLELQEIFKICKKNKIKTILSHRSGETMDDALADLSFGYQADFIKAGVATKWREVKLERLVKIEKNAG
ncbi:hypothetical protein J4462_01775 [Candidatus Pacearchaeota archaeon]|nr:hypothetical protein [Candidatus Pacearchaeota archaeon]